MNKQTIQELYYGKLSPIDLDIIEKKEYREHSRSFFRAAEEFAEKLPAELKEEFKRICEEEMKADEILHRDGFCKGFELGVKLTAEALI